MESGKFQYQEYSSLQKLDLGKGDLIEIKRNTYSHWAIFEELEEGNAMCYHLTNNGEIKRGSLADIARLENDIESIKHSRVRVNNQDKIVAQLETALRSEGKFPDIDKVFRILRGYDNHRLIYNVFYFNCEHFVTLIKHGIGWSAQMKTIKCWTKLSIGISLTFPFPVLLAKIDVMSFSANSAIYQSIISALTILCFFSG
jgi:hypothetical protein